jgi:hypothetical protein
MQCNQQDKTTCNAPATYKDAHATWYTERTAADKHMTRTNTKYIIRNIFGNQTEKISIYYFVTLGLL